jgi:hypothetical protein
MADLEMVAKALVDDKLSTLKRNWKNIFAFPM